MPSASQRRRSSAMRRLLPAPSGALTKMARWGSRESCASSNTACAIAKMPASKPPRSTKGSSVGSTVGLSIACVGGIPTYRRALSSLILRDSRERRSGFTARDEESSAGKIQSGRRQNKKRRDPKVAALWLGGDQAIGSSLCTSGPNLQRFEGRSSCASLRLESSRDPQWIPWADPSS